MAERAQRRGWARRIGVRFLQVVLGLVVGLVAAETAFCVRDHGAFPHLNVYVSDPKLGVRLSPGARQKVEFGGNPVTDVRINLDGVRGGPLPPPRVDDVLVLGDSQVFGLGVQENETFSAALAARIDKTVINAGVPTYGPLEYQALLEEWLPKRKPRTVLYVVNLANDLLEAKRPNVDRHAVWDGWAVRRETAPLTVSDFPGRGLLFRESHLVFAVRRLLHRRNGATDDDKPLPSEGSWNDLVQAAQATSAAKAQADDAQLVEWEKSLEDAAAQAIAAQKKLQANAQKVFPDLFAGPGGKEYLKKDGHPSDIVSEQVYASEAAAAPLKRVKVVLDGAKIRLEIEELLKKRAEAEIEKIEAKAILASLEERAKLEKKLAELRKLPAKLLRSHSPLFPALEKAKKTCDAHGARMFVVILPMDVQVSPEEWQKYGEAPIDLSATKVLSDDIRHAGEALGVTVVDLLPALASAEPGAFLNRDLHMSPKGHAAVAALLAQKLGEPPPVAAEAKKGPALGYDKVCACHKKAGHATCDGVTATPDVDCLRTHGSHCTKLLACVKGEASAAPKCLPGFRNHGPHHRCHQVCTPEGGCHFGKCTKVKEGRLCI